MELSNAHWLKSSRSKGGGECVELAVTLDEMRDSKDPHGPTLKVDVRRFVAAIQAGRFDR